MGKYSNTINLVSLTDSAFYTWIAYANSVDGADFSFEPGDRNYIGIAHNQLSATPSTNYKDYNWSLIRGDGEITYNSYTYETRSNLSELVKFKSADGEKQTFSPTRLEFQLYKISEKLEEELVPSNFSIYFTTNDQEELTSYSLDYTDINNPYFKDTLFVRDKLVILDVDNLLYSSSIDQYSTQEDQTGRINAIRSFLKSQFCLIRFIFKKETGEYLSSSLIPCRFGITSEMASLSLNAGNIVASIVNAGLIFDQSGLSLLNSSFRINNNQGETVLEAYGQGGIRISGNSRFEGEIWANSGRFSGEIYATSGSFKGSLEALEGTIGGIKIKQSGIYSDEGQGFEINSNGSIRAGDFTVANGFVESWLNVGDTCYIRNPQSDNSKGNFIEIYKETISALEDIDTQPIFVIDKFGKMKLKGNADQENYSIILDGLTGSIYGNNWDISPYQARFNNIIAKGTIETAIFEQGEVQTIGGMMLVRPSTIIDQAQVSTISRNDEDFLQILITPKNKLPSELNGYCEINGLIYEVKSEDEQIFLYRPYEDSLSQSDYYQNKLVVFWGSDKEAALGINSSNNQAAIPRYSFSIVQNSYENWNKISVPKVVLGDLSGVDPQLGLSGYGLYAENAYLKGQIISGKSDHFSGINTENQAIMPSGYFNEVGEIILWAGANALDPSAIEQAPFKVDSLGNMYAGQGYFEGSIITKSTIEAAEIQTVKITGLGSKYQQDNSDAALTISADNAIKFIQESVNLEKELMTLKSSGMILNIPLSVAGIAEFGDSKFQNIIVQQDGADYVSLQPSGLFFNTYKNNQSYLNSIQGASGKISFKNGDKITIELSENRIENKGEIFNMNNVYNYGEKIVMGEVMEYRKVQDGYDLYVSDKEV